MGYKPFSKQRVVRDLWYITEKGGFLVWLDVIVPIYSKEQWSLRGNILLLTGTNRRVRVVTIWERV